MKHSPFASAAGAFAHLLGRRPSGKRAEEDRKEDEQSKRAEEDDEEQAEEEDGDGDGDGEEDPDAEAEESDDDSEDDTKKKDAKKAKGAKGKTYAAGRSDERKRCAAIFSSPQAAGLPHVAAQLAFSTNLSSAQAVAVMAGVAITGQPEGKRGLGERMAHVESPAVGPDGGGSPEKGSVAETVARMTNAYNRATSGAAKK